MEEARKVLGDESSTDGIMEKVRNINAECTDLKAADDLNHSRNVTSQQAQQGLSNTATKGGRGRGKDADGRGRGRGRDKGGRGKGKGGGSGAAGNSSTGGRGPGGNGKAIKPYDPNDASATGDNANFCWCCKRFRHLFQRCFYLRLSQFIGIRSPYISKKGDKC